MANENLKDKLIELGLVYEDDWNAAELATRSSRSDDSEILDLLASPNVDTDVQLLRQPALTEFQRDQILLGNADGLRFPNQVVLDRVVQGNNSDIFIARNLTLPRFEALKAMPSDGQREAAHLALMRHPNFVTVFEAGSCNNVAFFTMEFADGDDVCGYVNRRKRGRPVTLDWCVHTVIKVADALQHAHGNGVIVRNIKPSHIMIGRANHVKVVDLSFAKLSGGSISPGDGGFPAGTLPYAAPELWEDPASAMPGSDIYSLGCTFYYFLTGEAPFPQEKTHDLFQAHRNAPRPRAAANRPDVPPYLDDVILRMMAADPADRYQSCEPLIDDLESIRRMWMTDPREVP